MRMSEESAPFREQHPDYVKAELYKIFIGNNKYFPSSNDVEKA